MTLRFLFVGEGSSDHALVEPLQELCLRLGASEVQGIAPDLRRSQSESIRVADKLETALQLEPNVDLVFIHRDSDDPDPDPRYSEIRKAVRNVDTRIPWIAVVPVQATEAWALVDENAIRRAADNPNGNVPIDIPRPSQVENISDPKSYLEDLLVRASEHSGRHLKRFRRDLAQRKFYLIEQLDLDGPVSQIPSWNRLRSDISEVLDNIEIEGSNRS